MIIKVMATGVLAGFLAFGAQLPASYAGDPAPAQKASVRPNESEGSLLYMLAPTLTDPVAHEPQKVCKPGQLYSSHDVVGDPDTCTMGRIDMRGNSGASAVPGGF